MRPMALPLAAALAGHGLAAALLLATPPRRLPPTTEPLAIAVLTPADALPAFAPGTADLIEPAPPGPVSWPDAASAAPLAVPRPAIPRQQRQGPPSPIPAIAPAPQAPASPSPSPDAIATWRAALSDWIDRNRRYPAAARFREEEGMVLLRFDVDPAGRVVRVVVERSSDSAILDAAAIALLTGATLAPPPAGLPPAQHTVSLPIRYRLD